MVEQVNKAVDNDLSTFYEYIARTDKIIYENDTRLFQIKTKAEKGICEL